MTARGGGRPPRASQAHRLADVELDDEHYARTTDIGSGTGRVRRGESPRAGGRQPRAPRDPSGFGLGGLVRFAAFIGILAVVVLIVSLTVLRPVVAGVVVDWASDNPSALNLPFVAELVREDLGSAMTEPVSDDASQVEFTVMDGDTAASIANRLAEQGFLGDARAFVFIATERDLADKLEAGTYILRRNLTPDDLVTALLVSKDQAVTIGLREGLRLEQITAKLQTLPLNGGLAKAFYDEVSHPPAILLEDYPWLDLPKGASLEGYLAPATYRVLPDVSADELVRRMLDRFHSTVGPDRLKVPKSRGLSFYQVLSLASIVEREAVLDEERALIAGVYQNRLDNRPYILNADPTVLYANDTAQLRGLAFDDWQTFAFWVPPGGGLKELQVPEDLRGYQTYQAAGLPPGPICTPTVASIDAALEPDDKAGYFYFVAIPDGGGKHDFSKTYAEHQKKLKKYGYL